MTAALDWADLTATALAREDLSTAQTAAAMSAVMAGDVSPVTLGGFLVALRAKGETADELVGLVDAMLEHAVHVHVPEGVGPILDTCGTGGDRSGTVNISTMAAIVVAATGTPVVKHGNRAASSASGSADVLEALGVAIDLSAERVAWCVESVGIGFCFAPLFHPGMRHAAQTRRDLGVPTAFNVLGPLANPASPAAQVVGCYDKRLAGVMAEALATRGVRALVVRGSDGLDEFSTSAPTQIWDARTDTVGQVTVDALDLGIPRPGADALRGGDPAHNAAIARAVFAGERGGSLGSVRDAVIVNAAAGLVARGAVNGQRDELPEALAAAIPVIAAAIDDGHAARTLQAWINFTGEPTSR